MRLYGSQTSPYVRKTRIVVAETGLSHQVEFVAAEGAPLDPPGLRGRNPLRKIPFLETTDGRLLFDSRVVAEALIAATPLRDAADGLLPPEGDDRFDALTRQALADGICDAAVAIAYETRLRPAEKQWSDWLDDLWSRVISGLDWLEASPRPEGRFDLGDCALAATLPYLDLRFGDRGWRDGRPVLSAWWEIAQLRPSVAATLS